MVLGQPLRSDTRGFFLYHHKRTQNNPVSTLCYGYCYNIVRIILTLLCKIPTDYNFAI